MKTFKKILAVMLSLLMVASVVVIPATAEDAAEEPAAQVFVEGYETGNYSELSTEHVASGTYAKRYSANGGYNSRGLADLSSYDLTQYDGVTMWVYADQDRSNLQITLHGCTYPAYYGIETKANQWTKVFLDFDAAPLKWEGDGWWGGKSTRAFKTEELQAITEINIFDWDRSAAVFYVDDICLVNYSDDAEAATLPVTVADEENLNATVKVHREGRPGDLVTFTADGIGRYFVESLSVTDAEGNTVALTDTLDGAEFDNYYAFVQPATAATINVVMTAGDHTVGETRDNGDGTHTTYCSCCDEELSTESHKFDGDYCVCGAKKPAITFIEDYENGGYDELSTEQAVSGTYSKKYSAYNGYNSRQLVGLTDYDLRNYTGVTLWVYSNQNRSNLQITLHGCTYPAYYAIETKANQWTKVYLDFSNAPLKWEGDGWWGGKSTRALREDELLAITDINIFDWDRSDAIFYIDDICLVNYAVSKDPDKVIEVTEDNVVLPEGAVFEDGKVKIPVPTSGETTVTVKVPAGTITKAQSVLYYYSSTASANPSVQCYLNSPWENLGDATNWESWANIIKRGEFGTSGAALTAGATSARCGINMTQTAGGGADKVYAWWGNTYYLNNWTPYMDAPGVEMTSTITDVNLRIYAIDAADQYIYLEKILVEYQDNPAFETNVADADTINGTVNVFREGREGDIVGFVVNGEDCYEVDTVTITDANGNNIPLAANVDAGNLDNYFTFVQPASDVTISATFVGVYHEDGDIVDNEDGTHSVYCAYCGEVMRTVDHVFEDGWCECGAEEPAAECTHENAKVYYDLEDGKWYKSCECGLKEETAANVDTVMGVSRSIILAEKIGIKFAVQASAQANALDKYDDYFIRIETQSYDGTYNLNDVVLDIASDDTYDATTSLISYSYMNLTSYEMTIPVNATIYYLKDGEIVACSKTYTDTLNDRAMTFAKKFDYSDLSSASAKEGAMYLNLIKYGIEAQKYFAKSNTNSNIATAELPTFEEGYEAYVTTAVPELTETKTNVKADGVTAAMSRNVIVGASNALLYKIQVKDTTIPSTADLSKLYLEVSYVSSTSKVGTVTETVCLADLELVSGTYRYNFEKVAIYDSHRKVTAKLYSIDNPENILITNTYSVESDAIKNINNDTDTDFWKAMAIFGHSALDFFGYDTAVE